MLGGAPRSPAKDRPSMKTRLLGGDLAAAMPGGVAWLVVAGAYLIVVYRTAWLADDAFITLRSVDNFVNGYGLRWNVSERVQTYTHPLWMLWLLLVYSVTREPFYTTLLVAIFTSLAALGVALAAARRAGRWAPLLVLPLTFSRSFVDYSTSGLENPLTHLLAALFYLWVVAEPNRLSSEQRLLRGALVLGASYVNRQDSSLLFAPAILWLCLRTTIPRVAKLRALAWGAVAPAVATGAAFVYYGSPFPNPAYAKLNVQVPRVELFERGLEYIVTSIRIDPWSVCCIVLAMALIAVRGRAIERALGLGVFCYLLYVVTIGGDFMAGRFLSAPVLLSGLLACAQVASLGRTNQMLYLMGAFGLLWIPDNPIWLTPARYPKPEEVRQGNGIVDERLYYFRDASLLHDSPERTIRPWHRRALEGKKQRALGPRVVAAGMAGYFGYFAGPETHFIDFWGVCDPLLARIPYRPKGAWRMGHFARKVPKGYDKAVLGNAWQLSEPVLSRVYADILLVTRGPLLSAARWRAIYRLNFGQSRRELQELRY